MTSPFSSPDRCTASPEVLDTLKRTASTLELGRVFQDSLETTAICNPLSSSN
ncbi:unnamed protein product [Hymenolepis diminuta]|uniref:Uncharacterized protein n=1 Tax=Hymenolepis diminuta TaxID=6216 RepID=A0A564Y1V0_HYMDI|nr:unnamed protein product [Hymenolepis diminuta]